MPLSLEPDAQNQQSASPTITLPRRIDARTVNNLHADIRLARGAALTLTADQVELLGAQGAALFLSAAKSWKEDNQRFEIKDPSEQFLSDLSVLGLSMEEVSAP